MAPVFLESTGASRLLFLQVESLGPLVTTIFLDPPWVNIFVAAVSLRAANADFDQQEQLIFSVHSTPPDPSARSHDYCSTLGNLDLSATLN